MVRLISRQRGGLAAFKLTKLFGIDDLPAAKGSGKVLIIIIAQPRPQGQLLDDFQNGGSSGGDPGKGWVTWYKISKNLGDFYHVTF